MALGVASGAAAAGCTRPPTPDAGSAAAGLDALNARIVRAYQTRDPRAYAALYTDSGVFEWPAYRTVRGSAALGAMARENWASVREMDLRLTPTARRVGAGAATEFGAFEQPYRDTAGVRRTEYGRYAQTVVRQADGSWRIDRFLGFEDSTRVQGR